MEISLEFFSHTISFCLKVGCVCNNAVIHADTLLGQPTEGALLAAGMKVGTVLCCDALDRLGRSECL